MSKKLNVTQLANEFASQSVFFKKNTTENSPVKIQQKVEQSIKDDRTIERSYVRSENSPSKPRSKKRHSFEFYEDQIEKLVSIRNQSSRTISMSKIVRDAIDQYFENNSHF